MIQNQHWHWHDMINGEKIIANIKLKNYIMVNIFSHTSRTIELNISNLIRVLLSNYV